MDACDAIRRSDWVEPPHELGCVEAHTGRTIRLIASKHLIVGHLFIHMVHCETFIRTIRCLIVISLIARPVHLGSCACFADDLQIACAVPACLCVSSWSHHSSLHWLDLPRLRSCACVLFTIHTDWQGYVYFIVVCKSVLCVRVRLCRQPPLGLRALCLGTDVRLSVLITFSFLPSLADFKIRYGGELKVTGNAKLAITSVCHSICLQYFKHF